MSPRGLNNLPEGTVIVDRNLNIVRNPRISHGRACTGRSWIGCIFIVGRYRGGESVRSLMLDYGLTRREVLNAIAYIEKRSGGER